MFLLIRTRNLTSAPPAVSLGPGSDRPQVASTADLILQLPKTTKFCHTQTCRFTRLRFRFQRKRGLFFVGITVFSWRCAISVKGNKDRSLQHSLPGEDNNNQESLYDPFPKKYLPTWERK